MNNLLSSALLAPFELVVNQCISRDRKLLEKLPGHTGKVLEIEVLTPGINIFVCFYPGSIRLSFVNEDEENIDGKITGSASDLLGILANRSSNRPLVNQGVQISGDNEFIQDVFNLFESMEIDWQDPLAAVVGDVPVHGLETLLGKLFAFTRETAQAVTGNIDEYLHEESRVTPPLNQIDIFDQDLDALKLNIDRLTARKQLLEQRLEEFEARPTD